MQTTIRNTPRQLVEDGKIHTGFFREPFRNLDLLAASNFGGRLAKPLRWLRLKEWVGFGISHPRLFGGIIIQNAKIAASGTVYLYDRETRRQHEWLLIDLPTRVQLPENLWQGTSLCRQGKDEMRFTHDLEHGKHRIHIAIQGTQKAPPLSVELDLLQDLGTVEPLVMSLPIAPEHHTYTQKSPLRLEGEVQVGDTKYEFDPARDIGNLDEQKTFYPYRSNWLWGTFGAYTDEGHQVMLNFVDQMTPKGEQGEDALWVNGKLMLMEQPSITPLSKPGDYRVEDKAGKLKLNFVADGGKVEKRNYGLIAMDYVQYFGAYDGEVTDTAGRRHRIRKAYGALERMSARF
jgi:hypothetical protein